MSPYQLVGKTKQNISHHSVYICFYSLSRVLWSLSLIPAILSQQMKTFTPTNQLHVLLKFKQIRNSMPQPFEKLSANINAL